MKKLCPVCKRIVEVDPCCVIRQVSDSIGSNYEAYICRICGVIFSERKFNS